MIKVVIFDDNQSRRESLKTLFDFSDTIQCVGAYPDGNQVLSDIAASMPDIVLMDIEMPGTNGIDAVCVIKREHPSMRIIMQTAFDEEEKVFAALQAGAEGYILKSATGVQIMQSIGEVMQGGASMSPSIALKVMRYFNQSTSKKDDYKLTPKESMVLGYLAKGNSYKMVADEMGISYFTVNNHIKKIYEKLQVHSLGEAIALVNKNGW
mgnify:CR=1 FL=1